MAGVIDQATFDRYLDAASLAKRNGYFLAEVLDSRNLLLTPQRELEIQLKVTDDLIRRLERQSVNKLMSYYFGRTDGTAAELFYALQQWFDTVRQHMADRTLGEL